MSLYENFLSLNMFRMLIHSSEGGGDYVGVLLCFGVYWCIGAVGALVPHPAFGYHPTPIYQYTPKQRSTPTYRHQLLRMNVITFETC